MYMFGRHDAVVSPGWGWKRAPAPDTEMVRGFDLIAQLAPLIAKHQGDGTMSAVLLAADDPPKNSRWGITPWRSRVCAPGLLLVRRQRRRRVSRRRFHRHRT